MWEAHRVYLSWWDVKHIANNTKNEDDDFLQSIVLYVVCGEYLADGTIWSFSCQQPRCVCDARRAIINPGEVGGGGNLFVFYRAKTGLKYFELISVYLGYA